MWEHEYFVESLKVLKQIQLRLDKILELLVEPKSLSIQWSVESMSANAVSLNLDATASITGTPVELNNDGSVFNFNPANIQWEMQTAGIANMAVNTTTGVATFTPLAVGTTQVAVNDSATGLTGLGQITVVAVGPTPSSLSIKFSTPVA